MSIVLFMLIGKHIEAGAVYWVCFGIYTICRSLKIGLDIAKEFHS